MLKNSRFWLLVIICNLALACLPVRQGAWNLNYLFAEEFKYDVKLRRDPFIPLVTPDGRLIKVEQDETVAGLSLQGIIYDKQGISYAIVNTDVVRIGDIIGQYQVLKIEENKVIFIKEGEPTEVELKKEEE